MRSHSLLRLALLLVLVALIAPTLKVASDAKVQEWAQWLLRGAGAVAALAVVAWLLEKIGVRVAGARCADCRRRVPYGHAYCYDHLRDRTHAAREKLHGERGSGI